MKTIYSVFIPIPGTELLKHSLSDESHESVLLYEWGDFWTTSKLGAGCQENLWWESCHL